MRRSRPARLPALGLLSAAVLPLLLFVGCENPVGLPDGIGAPEGNDPSIRTLAPDSSEVVPLVDRTGAFIGATANFDDFRALAGRANDPDFGTVTALGYLDVLPPSSFPEGFQDRPIRQATLRLERGYAYGDTTASTRFDLRQVAEEWAAIDDDRIPTQADTLFPVIEAVITTLDVGAGTTSIDVPLPDSWIAQNDTTLRSDRFSTLFHGFQLRAQDGDGAVYGFTGDSELELISAEDTVIYPVSELFSNIESEPPALAPNDDLIRLQDGVGLGLELKFDVDTLGTSDINTAFLRVNADTLAAMAPAGFVRPIARELALFGFVEDEEPVFFASATLNEETQTFSFGSSLLTDQIQELVLDRSRLSGFLIGFPYDPLRSDRSSLDVIPIVGPDAEGCPGQSMEPEPCPPRAVVILIPDEG